MNRLRNRLIAAFLVATVVQLGATLWITTSLLDRSFRYTATEELDTLSKTFEETAREFYQQARIVLKTDANTGQVSPQRYEAAGRAHWPDTVRDFSDSGETERFALSGPGGGKLDYIVRHGDDVWVYSRDLGNIQMQQLSDQYRRARDVVALAQTRDLKRGFTATLIVLVVAVWAVSFVLLMYAAHHIDQVQQNRERLIYLTQVKSWQTLSRKVAHELKNSLTPIRLAVEEIAARQTHVDRAFMDQAVQIVVNEIETLERRVRALSEFSSEPSPQPSMLDINGLVEERISFLKPGHNGLTYSLRLADSRPSAFADADQIKGILTNLLENAAHAAGNSGEVLCATQVADGNVFVEVHDSGPGLSEEASRSLFEPTITFKKQGMGLGLSIARKSALLNGGDIVLIEGELGGAGFRVVLPRESRDLK
jgi:signal transduction histidine kinase